MNIYHGGVMLKITNLMKISKLKVGDMVNLFDVDDNIIVHQYVVDSISKDTVFVVDEPTETYISFNIPDIVRVITSPYFFDYSIVVSKYVYPAILGPGR